MDGFRAGEQEMEDDDGKISAAFSLAFGPVFFSFWNCNSSDPHSNKPDMGPGEEETEEYAPTSAPARWDPIAEYSSAVHGSGKERGLER